MTRSYISALNAQSAKAKPRIKKNKKGWYCHLKDDMFRCFTGFGYNPQHAYKMWVRNNFGNSG